jgi:hypothetical protein
LETGGQKEANRRSVLAVIDDLLVEIGSPASSGWENRTLEQYLEALRAWLNDCDGYYENLGRPVPDNGWEIIADALQAARSYE